MSEAEVVTLSGHLLLQFFLPCHYYTSTPTCINSFCLPRKAPSVCLRPQPSLFAFRFAQLLLRTSTRTSISPALSFVHPHSLEIRDPSINIQPRISIQSQPRNRSVDAFIIFLVPRHRNKRNSVSNPVCGQEPLRQCIRLPPDFGS